MYNVRCVMEHALHILHYTLNPAVGVQLGIVVCKV